MRKASASPTYTKNQQSACEGCSGTLTICEGSNPARGFHAEGLTYGERLRLKDMAFLGKESGGKSFILLCQFQFDSLPSPFIIVLTTDMDYSDVTHAAVLGPETRSYLVVKQRDTLLALPKRLTSAISSTGLVPFRHYSTVIERMFDDVVAFFLFVFDALRRDQDYLLVLQLF
ncbi:hypothetical protein ARMGADRAFT_1036704 [Armillaria gallica]|uniref:Uncharacterized protein n=1 Tax=Armillaria gallica TaxID=47427 RepID=A0A2H3CPJ5_ARMGA|nr:hypothetical protein ARMGADRAFT_1036704 [Armillaria gallica]